MHFTHAKKPEGRLSYNEGRDAHLLRMLEQMVDRGDARLERVPDYGLWTHELTTRLGNRWLVFDREAK